tara:strand:+ start:253 stop:663 length:411 start_codon:yes stop_codon:yes gene_type:complete
MAKQIRKFEQDAIANEIVNNIVASRKLGRDKIEKSNKFKPIKKVQKDLIDIQEAITKLETKRNLLRTKLGRAVEIFNLNNKKNKLSWDSYRYSTSWDDRAYELRHDVERKLAIALIDPDWQKKLHDIINQITKELS